MKQFKSPGEFVAFLGGVRAALPEAKARGLRDGAQLIADEMRNEIGTYQSGDAGFEDWKPLSQATLDGFGPNPDAIGKIPRGFAPPDNPLLASGAGRESIGFGVDGDEAQVGTNDQVLIWQNQGTSARGVPYIKGVNQEPGIPAREFIARSAFRMSRKAALAAFLPVLRLFTDNVPEEPNG